MKIYERDGKTSRESLRTLIQDRMELQHELAMLEGESELTNIARTVIPRDATEAKISTLAKKELSLCRQVAHRIKELDKIKEEQSHSSEYLGESFRFC